jgi:hypothetical protein
MTRVRKAWLAVAAALAVLVAYQTVVTASERAAVSAADVDLPSVAPGADVLAGVAVVPARIRQFDYRRAAFGDAWTDDNSAPGGHNGCDTRFLGGFGVLGKTPEEVKFKPGTLR